MTVLGQFATRTAEVKSFAHPDHEPRPIRWLLPQLLDKRVPVGCLTLLAGQPGAGKSTWAMAIAARLTRQDDHVLFIGAEDGASQVLVPRLMAANGDRERCHLMTVKMGGGSMPPLLPTDIALIEHEVKTKPCALVVIDTFAGHLAEDIDANSDPSLRRALVPFAEMLQRTGTTALAIMHQNKSAKAGTLLNSINGGTAYGGVARSALIFGEVRGRDDPADRGVFHVKSNYAKRQAPLLTQIKEVAGVHTHVHEMSACSIGLPAQLDSKDLIA